MPIYEYHCSSCQAEVSVLYPTIAAAPRAAEATCPTCGGVGLERRMSRFGFASRRARGAKREHPKGAQTGGEDPRDLARAMHSASAGGDSDFKEVAARLERGESATSVETSLRKRVGETMQAH